MYDGPILEVGERAVVFVVVVVALDVTSLSPKFPQYRVYLILDLIRSYSALMHEPMKAA